MAEGAEDNDNLDNGGAGDGGAGDGGNIDNSAGGAGDGGTGGDGGAGGAGGGSDDNVLQFPENWRNQIAGDDEKRLAQLERFPDVNKFGEAYFNAQEKIRTAQHKQELPDDASEEMVKEWREANGIPLEAKDYKIDYEEGVVVGEADQKFVDGFLETAHGLNLSPAQASTIVNSFFKSINEDVELASQADAEDMQSRENILRQDWAQDYQRNLGVLDNVWGRYGELGDLLKNARLPGGQTLQSHPGIVKMLVESELQINPAVTIVPNAGQTQSQTVDSRIAEIEKMMRVDRKGYDADQKVQEEYRNLLDTQERLRQQNA